MRNLCLDYKYKLKIWVDVLLDWSRIAASAMESGIVHNLYVNIAA